MNHPNNRHPSTGAKPILTEIITHVRPHTDELFAIWLIICFGHNTWQIRRDDIKVRYAESDDEANLLATATSVLVGIGGGRYDEHKKAGREKQECAASLVAKDLKDKQGRSIEGILELNMLLKEIIKADKGEVKGYFSFPTILNKMQRQGFDSGQILDMALDVFDACFADAQEFYRACEKDFGTAKMKDQDGFRVAIVDSDLEAMGAFARTRKHINVVIQRNGGGNVAIFTDPRGAKLLPDLVRAILRQELVLSGQLSRLSEAQEVVDGIVRDNAGRNLSVASHWYYHVEANMFLNGSKSKPGVTPTALDDDMLLGAFAQAVESFTKADRAKPSLVASG